jgi:hypothetical protein
LVASFEISQKATPGPLTSGEGESGCGLGEIIISAIKNYLSFTTAIYLDKTNSSKLKVTGVRSLENVIKFLGRAPVKLLGNKRLQYLL